MMDTAAGPIPGFDPALMDAAAEVAFTRGKDALKELLDLAQVVAAGDQVLVVGRAEDQAGGAGRAALIDRHQALGQGMAGTSQARFLHRQLGAGALHLAAQLGGALLAFGQQAAEPFLMGCCSVGFTLGGRVLGLAFAQTGGDRARFAAGGGELGFEGARIGGAGTWRDRERNQQRAERHRCADGREILS